MKEVEFWQWWIVSQTTHKLCKTSWRMTAEQALAMYPEAERVEGSCEIRLCPEKPEEYDSASAPRPAQP
jgi:hypothetical protein